MDGGALWLLLLAAGVIWILRENLTADAGRQKRQEQEKAHYAAARAFAAEVQARRGLAPVSAPLLLKRGETAYYHAAAGLLETRAVRQYEAGHVGFRVAKGVYLGGSRGRSVSNQEWSHIDDGGVTITNKRLVFDGAQTDRVVPLTKLLSANAAPDGVEISAENRKKSMIFTVADPLIMCAVAQLCHAADDPGNLGEGDINFDFGDEDPAGVEDKSA